MDNFKKIFLNIIVSIYILFIVFFLIKTAGETRLENYYWNGYRGADAITIPILETALFKIFWIELTNHYLLATGSVITILLLIFHKNIKQSLLIIFFAAGIIFLSNTLTKNSLLQQYLIVYEHQQVPESEVNKPLYKAGKDICKLINKRITEYDFANIRYGIGALGKYRYQPATENLKKILENSSTEFYIKGDCIEALEEIGTDESKTIALNFRNNLNVNRDSVMISYLKLIDEN